MILRYPCDIGPLKGKILGDLQTVKAPHQETAMQRDTSQLALPALTVDVPRVSGLDFHILGMEAK